MKNKLGQRAADTSEVVFEDLRLPKDALLGEEGTGFKIAMQTFDRSRPEIGAICIGVSQRALDESLRYAKERQQFGQAIVQFQAIQFMLADMAVEVEGDCLLTYKPRGYRPGDGADRLVRQAFGADHAMNHHRRGQIFKDTAGEGILSRSYARRQAIRSTRHQPISVDSAESPKELIRI